MSAQVKFEKAFFVVRDPNAGAPKRNNISSADSIPVKFNPTSLQYVITNTMSDPSRGNKKKQYVSKSSAKLTMDLIFDSTDEGGDVRIQTNKIAKLMKPDKDKNNAPPVVLFAWGNFMFQGMVDGFKETIDFFSANGVPLRSSVNVTMSQQDDVFQDIDTDTKFKMQQSLALDAVEVPASANQSPAATAAQGGNSRAARDIAAANDLESTRSGAGAAMTVAKSAQLKPPVAFASGGASAGAGLSLSGGAGLSLGGGVGAGVGGGISLSGSAGGRASAGVSASEGAFAGLRVSASAKSSQSIDPGRLVQRSASSSLATDAGASFNVGGKATLEGSSSLKADVGANADLRARIQFDEK